VHISLKVAATVLSRQIGIVTTPGKLTTDKPFVNDQLYV